MINYLLLLLLIISSFSSQPLNTKTFWEQQLTHKIHFNTYSGYEEIDWYYPKSTTGMFYQLFGAYGVDLKLNSTHPIFLWLQGGPGGSSQFGALTQIGPIKITKGKVDQNNWAWNTFGHLLFVDSPLNVGFSFSDKPRNGTQQVSSTDQATKHLINFLHNFYQTWPTLVENKIYIVGESFGGHYVPDLANKLLSNSSWSSKVAGVIIGDGWTDPPNQINYYDTYLWSVGVIDKSVRETCTWFQTQSMLNMDLRNFQKATDYFDFLTNNDTTAEVHFGNISMFNFRNYDSWDVSFADFLQTNKDEIGAKVDYILSNPQVYSAFGPDITQSKANQMVKVLRKTRVLIYNGQNDVVVNTPGVLHYLSSLDWEHIHQWKKAKKQIYTISKEVAGWAKTYQNLWFVLVNGAGHLVPIDQPTRTFHMIAKFINKQNKWEI